jgi:hypothetical protein
VAQLESLMNCQEYQLVLQFPDRWLWSFHSLIRLEDQLIRKLGDSACVDGHDCGSGEMNIFILTSQLVETFQTIRPLLARKLWLRLSAAAYRGLDEESYTVIWPEGSQKTFMIK